MDRKIIKLAINWVKNVNNFLSYILTKLMIKKTKNIVYNRILIINEGKRYKKKFITIPKKQNLYKKTFNEFLYCK